MQPEILRFLLLARAHLRDFSEPDRVDGDHADMQAIDRELPDTDWFELAEVDLPGRPRALDLWGERGGLQFR